MSVAATIISGLAGLLLPLGMATGAAAQSDYAEYPTTEFADGADTASVMQGNPSRSTRNIKHSV